MNDHRYCLDDFDPDMLAFTPEENAVHASVAIMAATSLEELEEVRLKYLGRKGYFTMLLGAISRLNS